MFLNKIRRCLKVVSTVYVAIQFRIYSWNYVALSECMCVWAGQRTTLVHAVIELAHKKRQLEALDSQYLQSVVYLKMKSSNLLASSVLKQLIEALRYDWVASDFFLTKLLLNNSSDTSQNFCHRNKKNWALLWYQHNPEDFLDVNAEEMIFICGYSWVS